MTTPESPQALVRSRSYVRLLMLAALLGVVASAAAYRFLALVDYPRPGVRPVDDVVLCLAAVVAVVSFSAHQRSGHPRCDRSGTQSSGRAGRPPMTRHAYPEPGRSGLAVS